MKKAAFLFVLLSLILTRSCVFGDWNNGISGDGNVVSEEIDVTGFTGVYISSGIDVHISQGDYSVELVADENLHEFITIEREGNMLRVGSERSIQRAKSKMVHVSLPELNKIKISSAGDVKGMSEFKCEELDISISSAGDLDLTVDADEIKLGISSSGDCTLRGSAKSLDANLSSAGDLHAFELFADHVKVSVSSAGDARVWANEEIEMSASSAGNIYYKGDAKVIRSSSSSAGSIIKK
jgi:hypothetical protein